MRIDLSDLDRLDAIAEALGRLFWCLVVVAFFAAILGSAGTGLLVLILGAASFCARVGFEDFVRARRGEEKRDGKGEEQRLAKRDEKPLRPRRVAKAKPVPAPQPEPEPEFTVYRSARRPRRTRSAT